METEDLKVDVKEVKMMAKILNESGLAEKRVKTVGISNVGVIEAFLEAVESVDPTNETKLDLDVAKMYNDLTAQLEGKGEQEKEPEVTVKVTEEASTKDECPVFKKGWDAAIADCQACEKAYPEDYKECMEACSAVTETKTKATKAPKQAAGPGVIASILEFIQKGPVTTDQIVEQLAARFPDREATKMKKTVSAQLKGSRPCRMEKEKNITMTVDDGKYSVKKVA